MTIISFKFHVFVLNPNNVFNAQCVFSTCKHKNSIEFHFFLWGGLGCVLIQKPLQVKVKSGSVNFAFNITLDMISIIKLCTN